MPSRLLAPAAAVLLALSAAAGASAAPAAQQPLKNGYYVTVPAVKSADVSFLVNKHGATVDQVSLQCTPSDDGQGVFIGVDAPVLKVKNGKLTYHGPATVNDGSYGDESFATSTLKLKLKHVSGPAAWKGTVSSPACTKAGQGSVTLFAQK